MYLFINVCLGLFLEQDVLQFTAYLSLMGENCDELLKRFGSSELNFSTEDELAANRTAAFSICGSRWETNPASNINLGAGSLKASDNLKTVRDSVVPAPCSISSTSSISTSAFTASCSTVRRRFRRCHSTGHGWWYPEMVIDYYRTTCWRAD